ncbi:MAG TPA: response regulator, partial [Verrucomicrobiae bacterium]|nr:response regulator [Verrucomicrobiae bacterium]
MAKFAANLLDSLPDDATPEAEIPQPIAARVLIIDDEPCVCELLGEMLELMGHRARQCNSPVDALKFIECEDFDVILSDFRMPQMNGDQFYAQAIQKRPDLARRIVFLTGDLVNEETQAFLKESGS